MFEPAAVFVPVERLRPWLKNPRHNDAAVDAVVKSIRRFGFGAPIIARKENHEIIAGHTRVKAAIRLGMAEVPVRYMDLDEAEAHALAIADNKLGELAEWDTEALAAMVAEDGGEGLLDLGFSEHELEDLIGEVSERGSWTDGKPASAERRTVIQLHVEVGDATGAIEAAITKALDRSLTRGEALALICREWTDAQG